MQEGLDTDPALLQPTWYIDSDHPRVAAFAAKVTGGSVSKRDSAVRLFYAVRDAIRYDPYTPDFEPERCRASHALARGASFCSPKAILLAACARATGIPSRLRFADVRNHLATPRLLAILRTDLFAFHGFTELLVEGRWVKATPTFNLSLCERFGVKALDFDGIHDATLHPFDREGQRHMEYVRDRGSYADFPREEMLRVYRRVYPHLFDERGRICGLARGADFEQEAGTVHGDECGGE